jgi:hypothetical protein
MKLSQEEVNELTAMFRRRLMDADIPEPCPNLDDPNFEPSPFDDLVFAQKELVRMSSRIGRKGLAVLFTLLYGLELYKYRDYEFGGESQ